MIMSSNVLPLVRGTYRFGASLANTTWFGVGGAADVLFRPEDELDLANFLSNLDQSTPYIIIGVGSNLLVRDGGFRGVVIRLGRGFNSCKVEGEKLYAGAGCLNYNVVQYAAEHCLSGIEFLSGVPGTIGGALAMNAGCYGKEISEILETAKVLDPSGKIHVLTCYDIGYVYRGNTLPDGWIFTEACFKLHKEDKDKIISNINAVTERRNQTQPIKAKTGGSTFKNPPNYKAWQLIDKSGMRGFRLGGAMVSEKHCNFLINEGTATAAEIENLGEEIRQKVKKDSGIELEWEIQIIGDKL